MEDIDKSVRNCFLFDQVSADAIFTVLGMAQKIHFPEGSKILEQNTLGQGVYIIAKGDVQVFLKISQHESIELSKLTAGDILGEMSVLIDTPRAATAVATTDVDVYFLDSSDIKQHIADNDVYVMQMMCNLARILAKRLYQSNQFLSTLWTERSNAEHVQRALEDNQILLSKILM